MQPDSVIGKTVGDESDIGSDGLNGATLHDSERNLRLRGKPTLREEGDEDHMSEKAWKASKQG